MLLIYGRWYIHFIKHNFFITYFKSIYKYKYCNYWQPYLNLNQGNANLYTKCFIKSQYPIFCYFWRLKAIQDYKLEQVEVYHSIPYAVSPVVPINLTASRYVGTPNALSWIGSNVINHAQSTHDVKLTLPSIASLFNRNNR